MTGEEIEKALKDRAYEISYGDHNDKWIVPKDKLSQETLSYIDRLKEACQSAVQSFTRLETLYKVKCMELECAKEQIRKDTSKEILQGIHKKCDDLVANNSPESLDFVDFARDTLLTELCNKYGVEVDDE